MFFLSAYNRSGVHITFNAYNFHTLQSYISMHTTTHINAYTKYTYVHFYYCAYTSLSSPFIDQLWATSRGSLTITVQGVGCLINRYPWLCTYRRLSNILHTSEKSVDPISAAFVSFATQRGVAVLAP